MTYTKRKLGQVFTPYELAALVSVEALKPVPRKRGQMQSYECERLPTKEEAHAADLKRYTTTIAELVSDAFTEFEILGEELQDWHDNLSDGLQQTDKANTLEESASTLGGLSEPEVPTWLSERKVLFHPDLNARSRADRNSDACAMLNAVVNECDDIAESDKGFTDEQKDEAQALRDEVQSAADDAEGVEFPGMY